MKSFEQYLLFIALLLLACTSTSKTSDKTIVQISPSGQEIVIGMVDSFSGSRAEFGNAARNGLLLAVESWNQSNDIHGRKVRVEMIDDEGLPEKSKAGFLKLVQEKKITGFIGASASSRSLAIAPLAQEYKIPMITPSSTHPDVTSGGDYIFRACFIDTFQGTMMGQFLRKQLSIKTLALFVDEDLAYSQNLAKVLKETFVKLGGKILIEESYHGDEDIHFDKQLRAIQLKKPDAVYIPGFYSNVTQIVAQARNLGLRTMLVGGDGWDSDKLFDQAGSFLDGSVFSSHFSPYQTNAAYASFKEKFESKYRRQPNAFSALAFDAAMMLFEAMKRAETLTPENIKKEISVTKNFDGVTGKITLDTSRNAIKPVTILKIQSGKPAFVTSYSPN